MKKTQRIDALRNILRQIVSFLSITIVVLLGTGIFLACRFSATAIERSADEFYRSSLFRDIEVKGTRGITEEDVEETRKISGVTDAEGIFGLDMLLEKNETIALIHAITQAERMDTVTYLEGRAPARASECAIVYDIANHYGLGVGDTVVIRGVGEDSDFLNQDSFTITGIIRHPRHIRRGIEITGDVIIMPEAVDEDALGSPYTEILVQTDTHDFSSFSNEYKSQNERISEAIEELGIAREALKDDDIDKKIADAEAELAEAEDKLGSAGAELVEKEAELADADAELTNARADLVEAENKLTDAETKLSDGEKELADAKKELDDALSDLEKAREELDDKHEELADARAELRDVKASLDRSYAEIDRMSGELSSAQASLNALRAQIDAARAAAAGTPEMIDAAFAAQEAEYEKQLNTYNSQAGMLNAARTSYNASASDYNSSVDKYNASDRELASKEAEYEENKKKYEDNLAEYNDSAAELEEKKQEVADARAELEDGKKTLEENQAEYDDAVLKLKDAQKELADKQQEYDDSAQELEDAKKEADEAGEGKWIATTRRLNVTFSEMSDVIRQLMTIGQTLGLLFVLLAALVCYATLGKIIDEQKKLVGTTKALGFFKMEVFAKYLFFGLSAMVTGELAGILFAYFGLQTMMISPVTEVYMLDSIPKCFLPVPSAMVLIAAIVIAAAAAYFACAKLLRLSSIRLMNGDIPTTFFKRRTTKASKSSGSLYAGLIFRNMVTDLQRVMITVVSIAGCCMLLVISMSMRQGYVDLLSRHFDTLVRYDANVTFNENENKSVEEEMNAAVEDQGGMALPAYLVSSVIKTEAGKEAVQLICADPEELSELYALTDAATYQPISVPEEGVVIFSRLAEVYGVKAGDSLRIMDENGGYKTIEVSGIYRCYCGRTILMSQQYAEQVFDDASANSIAVRYGSADPVRLRESIKGIKGFLKYESLEETRQRYAITIDMLDVVILLAIIMATILAAVVLLNLVRIQINQKHRELVVMRINGFTVYETVMYILRENMVTTASGIVLGIIVGNYVGSVIMRQMESMEIQMTRELMARPSIQAAMITVVFAVVVNYLALKDVRKMKLSDMG